MSRPSRDKIKPVCACGACGVCHLWRRREIARVKFRAYDRMRRAKRKRDRIPTEIELAMDYRALELEAIDRASHDIATDIRSRVAPFAQSGTARPRAIIER